MKEKYQAAFIIPIGTQKFLSEDGWEFESPIRLSEEIKDYFVQLLRLEFVENYLDIDVYTNESIKMSVINDEQGCIESISFQLYGESLNNLSDVCANDNMFFQAELFIPTQNQKGKGTY